NPWGTGGGKEQLPNGNLVSCGGTVTATASQLWSNFSYAGQAGAVAALSSRLETTAVTENGTEDPFGDRRRENKPLGMSSDSQAALSGSAQARDARVHSPHYAGDTWFAQDDLDLWWERAR